MGLLLFWLLVNEMRCSDMGYWSLYFFLRMGSGRVYILFRQSVWIVRQHDSGTVIRLFKQVPKACYGISHLCITKEESFDRRAYHGSAIGDLSDGAWPIGVEKEV